MVTQWDYVRVTQWSHSGHTVVSQSCGITSGSHSGHTVVTQWSHSGHTVVTQWSVSLGGLRPGHTCETGTRPRGFPFSLEPPVAIAAAWASSELTTSCKKEKKRGTSRPAMGLRTEGRRAKKVNMMSKSYCTTSVSQSKSLLPEDVNQAQVKRSGK